MAILTAAACLIGSQRSLPSTAAGLRQPRRIVLICSFPQTRANALIAIAENDDADHPQAKTALRDAYRKANLLAEIEVYAGTRHGWCVPDAKIYDAKNAEHAWSRLLVLLSAINGAGHVGLKVT